MPRAPQTIARSLRLELAPNSMQRLDRLKAEMEAASYSEVIRELLRRAEAGLLPAVAAPRAVQAVAPQPERDEPAEAPVAPAETVIPVDDLALRRERGLVAGFIRIDGREWRGQGPTPLEPGCRISAAVLAEFEAPLAGLRARLAALAAEEQRFRMGMP